MRTKSLWNHMATCNNSMCTVKHCYTSRLILTHFLNCNDDSCEVCKPVKMKSKVTIEERRLGGQNVCPSVKPG